MSIEDYTQSHFDYQGFEIPENVNLKATLFPHQKEAVEWMMYREQIPHDSIRGGLLLDTMGLGKTLTALTCALIAGGTTLILVPAQLVYVWSAEIAAHFENISFYIYHGTNRRPKYITHRLHNTEPLIMIMSYQSLGTDIDDQDGPLNNMNFVRIIYDECHYIKNKNTATFKNVMQIKSDIKWFLSGTPIMNRVHELYPYFKLLNYKHINTVPYEQVGHMNRTVYSKVRKNQYTQLQQLLKVVAIRRTKDVLLQLPTKTFVDAFINLNEFEKEFYDSLKEYSQVRIKKLMRNIRRVSQSGLPPADQNRMRIIIMQCMLHIVFHLRLACCDPLLIIDKIPRIRGMSLENSVIELKKYKNDCNHNNDCPVCINQIANVYQLWTSCMCQLLE